MTKRDRLLLERIKTNQNQLLDVIRELHISSPSDLNAVHFMMRRGMVQTVADIFELTVPLNADILQKLPLNYAIIKQFRNTASHNYGQITNILAYACITHCTDKQLINVIGNLLKEDV